MPALRYQNLAAPVLLTVPVNDSAVTLTVGSTSSFPDPPFLIGIDRGTPDEEAVLCTAKTPTTFTVTRGFDGTTGVSHAIGALVEHTTTAIVHRRAGIADVTTAERDALAAEDLWTGRTVYNTTTGKLQYWNGSVWVNVGPRAGAIEGFGGGTAPPGTFLCQGQEISRTDFADLFAAIGEAYGNGDGSTTFNLPDLQQRLPLGKAASGTGDTLGDTGGEIDHDHTNPNTGSAGSHAHSMPSHSHNVNIGSFSTSTTGSHNHGGDTGGASYGGGGAQFNEHSGNQDTHDHSISSAGNHSHSVNPPNTSTTNVDPGNTNSNGNHSHSQGNTGASNPPFLVVNFIVYT